MQLVWVGGCFVDKSNETLNKMSTFDKIETIDKVIEICFAFKKDVIENGNELDENQDEKRIIGTITHAFYILGYKKNGWINFPPYRYDYSLRPILSEKRLKEDTIIYKCHSSVENTFNLSII